jgi:hypothetical protein
MQESALADEASIRRTAAASTAITAVVRWIPSTVGTVLMRTSQTPFYMHFANRPPFGSLCTSHEVPKLRYQAVEAEEYSAEKPKQAKPWPMKIFTEVIATQETGENRRREFESDNSNTDITGRAG